MELIALVFIWPFLILAFGLAFIAFNDLAVGSFGLIFLALLFIFGFLVRENNKHRGQSSLEQLQTLRQLVLILSIGFLIPIFTRYLFDSFDHTLPVVILGLVIGFGLTIWGMFERSNKTLTYANIIGGGLTIVYVYFQIWDLGGLARIVAAAFGLIVAVAISTIKLKDKLT